MELLLLLPAFIGIGWLINRKAPVFLSFWLGAAAVTAMLPLLHLFSPIKLSTLLFIGGVGFAGGLLKLFTHSSISVERRSILFILIVIPLIIYRLFNPTYNYDDGLYHLQVMSWYSQYSVVPGLANLHGRFGFNSAFYLLTTLANEWTIPLLLIGFAGFVGETPTRRFAAWFIPPLLLLGWVGYSNDFALVLFGAVAISNLWLVIEKREISSTTLLLLVVLPTIKLSAALLSIGCLLILCYPLSRRKLWMLVLGGIAYLPSLVHSVMLSGYPLYPLNIFGIPVDWRIPNTLIDLDAAWIYSWARLPGAPLSETIGTWSWVGKWLQNQQTEPILIFALVVLLLLLPLTVTMRLKRSFRIGLILPALAALAYWFVTAPDIRFAVLPLWMLVGVSASVVTERRQGFGRALFLSILIVSALTALTNLGMGAHSTEAQLTTYVTEQGTTIYQPAPPTDQCWDAPLPCSPYRIENLRQRGVTLDQGFTLESFQLQ